eukprot:TRINITY_DN497_c0_g1_i11.p1 TRINITY_DN497_c0_g1~~TRINITY_DN497_c0_g1_i11.p1  ORF type:complete len:315 (+),score=158.59 TRINITY_DN497_c0_g1_i11:1015-1959(+)
MKELRSDVDKQKLPEIKIDGVIAEANQHEEGKTEIPGITLEVEKESPVEIKADPLNQNEMKKEEDKPKELQETPVTKAEEPSVIIAEEEEVIEGQASEKEEPHQKNTTEEGPILLNSDEAEKPNQTITEITADKVVEAIESQSDGKKEVGDVKPEEGEKTEIPEITIEVQKESPPEVNADSLPKNETKKEEKAQETLEVQNEIPIEIKADPINQNEIKEEDKSKDLQETTVTKVEEPTAIIAEEKEIKNQNEAVIEGQVIEKEESHHEAVTNETIGEVESQQVEIKANIETLVQEQTEKEQSGKDEEKISESEV